MSLSDKLQFICEDGSFDWTAIDLEIDRKFRVISNPNRYPRSIFAKEFANFTAGDWRHLAEQEVKALADGERALWEVRKMAQDMGLKSVADLVAQDRVPAPYSIAAE